VYTKPLSAALEAQRAEVKNNGIVVTTRFTFQGVSCCIDIGYWFGRNQSRILGFFVDDRE
jgi:hypothetical protein